MIMQMEIASIIKVQPCINWLRFYSDNFFSRHARHSGSSSNLRSSTLYVFGIETGITGTNADLFDRTNTQISAFATLPALPPGKSWNQYFLYNIPIKWYAEKSQKSFQIREQTVESVYFKIPAPRSAWIDYVIRNTNLIIRLFL